MKRLTYVICLLSMSLLSGCMTCMSPSCLGYETYNRLMHPKPYGTHWIKEGMTQESRRNDSWSCGAAKTIHAADYVVFSEAQKISARIPTDKDDYGPDERLTVQWNTCMKSKGYVYLDQCDGRCLNP